MKLVGEHEKEGAHLIEVCCSMKTLSFKQTSLIHSIFLTPAQEEANGFSLEKQSSCEDAQICPIGSCYLKMIFVR